jgi:hypothetical protein
MVAGLRKPAGWLQGRADYAWNVTSIMDIINISIF